MFTFIFDKISPPDRIPGGNNFINGSEEYIVSSADLVKSYTLNTVPREGDKVTVSIKGEIATGRKWMVGPGETGTHTIEREDSVNGIYALTFTWNLPVGQSPVFSINHTTGSESSIIEWVKLEREVPLDTTRDISSKDFGITVATRPDLQSADLRIESQHIEGTDITYIEHLGAGNYQHSVPIYIEGKENIDKIKQWLTGRGWLERSDTPGRKLEVIMDSTLNVTYLYEDIYEASVSYTVVNPHWVKTNDKYIEVFQGETTATVVNTGTQYARPIIEITKGTTDKGDLSLGGVRFLYDFTNSPSDFISIDCDTQVITDKQGRDRNRNIIIGYDFPTLPTGSSTANLNSGDAIIRIRRKDRWK